MRIPKSKMPVIVKELDLLLSIEEDRSEEARELIATIRDRFALCMSGDGTAIDIEVYYGT